MINYKQLVWFAYNKITQGEMPEYLKGVIASKITHKNVCRTFHIGKENGTSYITMDFGIAAGTASPIIT